MTGLGNCRSCKRRIRWVTMPSGKSNPLDADEIGPEEIRRGGVVALEASGRARVLGAGESPPPDAELHLSHFATCPNRRRHRRTQAPILRVLR